MLVCCLAAEGGCIVPLDFVPPCHFYTCCAGGYLLVHPCCSYERIDQYSLSNYCVPSIVLSGKCGDAVCAGVLQAETCAWSGGVLRWERAAASRWMGTLADAWNVSYGRGI